MFLKILTENTVYFSDAKAEHGFALYIETDDGQRILFDTGQTDVFAENASLFGIDISKIDSLVLSHGHYDHAGGIKRFLEINSTAKIYVKQGFDEEKLNRVGKYIGFPKDIKIPSSRICFVKEQIEIANDVFVLPQIDIFDEEDTHFENLFVKKENDKKADFFDDELFLVLQNQEKIGIVSGCAHRGIINIIKSAKREFALPISLVLGGFHTIHSDEKNVLRLANQLQSFEIERLVPCHCTGVNQYALMKQYYNGNIEYGSVGLEINL